MDNLVSAVQSALFCYVHEVSSSREDWDLKRMLDWIGNFNLLLLCVYSL
jgi:hypothetical protein